ncbi:helix-turn-helix domain-containing protein [Methylophaga sp.]|uniref:helix-turn-helix domain-containing protein n=1 Tax=Methylophaga sp. TaxID=2024840 RepID=UPI003A8D5726
MSYRIEVDVDASPLSRKENEVYRLAAEGKYRPAIAALLHRSPGTVNTHFNHILQKLNVDNIQQAIAVGFIKGILKSRDKLVLALFIGFTSVGSAIPSTVYAMPISDWAGSHQQPVQRSRQRGRSRVQVRSSASLRAGNGRRLD